MSYFSKMFCSKYTHFQKFSKIFCSKYTHFHKLSHTELFVRPKKVNFISLSQVSFPVNYNYFSTLQTCKNVSFCKRVGESVSGRKILCMKKFHTTSPTNALPAVALLILRPLTKMFVMICSITLRSWWKKLTPDKKVYYKKLLGKYKYFGLGVATILGFGIFGFYVNHLEEDPLTGRKRFLAFSEEQMKEIAFADQTVVLEKFSEFVMPESHPVYKKIKKLAMHILESNKDVKNISHFDWSIIVIDAPDVSNSFVLPNGTIFVFCGMVKMCDNMDQLGIILCHEIAHALMAHMTEVLSSVKFNEYLLLIPIAISWTVLPAIAAIIMCFLTKIFVTTLIDLPFSRSVEVEADELGLKLAAKACLDVREASAFWKKVKLQHIGDEIPFLSTHPSSESRHLFIENLLPAALDLRNSCKCHKLEVADPRDKYNLL